MRTKRRTFIKGAIAAAGSAVVGFPGLWIKGSGEVWAQSKGDIPVGILYSLTGTTAIVERSMSQTALMAIEEINKNGGVLGRKLRPIVEDPASTPKTYSEKARKLILQDKVVSIFGCYTTASRKAVKPVVESQNNLLVWPTWYEGQECSKNIFYAGSAVPNQQLENSIPWLVKKMGRKKIFIVGSDYAFPRGMAKVIKTLAQQLNVEVVGDEYLPLGHTEWAAVGSKISASGADAVFSNVVGDSIVAFYREFRNQGLSFEKIPVVSSTTTEVEIKAMGAKYAEGSYISLPYFQTVDTPENARFVDAFKRYAGKDSVTHAAMEAVYIGAHVWAQAAVKAGKAEPLAIRDAVGKETFTAPQGPVKIDPVNLHTYLTPRIGRVKADGMMEIVDQYREPLIPLPYSIIGETPERRICTTGGEKLA